MYVSRQNHVTGIVLCQGRVFKITVPSSFLVFDAVSWTQSQKALLIDQARAAESDGDHEAAREDFEVASELEHWLQNRTHPVRALPLLALRQSVKPHVVRLSSIYLWVNYPTHKARGLLQAMSRRLMASNRLIDYSPKTLLNCIRLE